MIILTSYCVSHLHSRKYHVPIPWEFALKRPAIITETTVLLWTGNSIKLDTGKLHSHLQKRPLLSSWYDVSDSTGSDEIVIAMHSFRIFWYLKIWVTVALKRDQRVQICLFVPPLNSIISKNKFQNYGYSSVCLSFFTSLSLLHQSLNLTFFQFYWQVLEAYFFLKPFL